MKERRLPWAGPAQAGRAQQAAAQPADTVYEELRAGSGKHQVATTQAMVRLFKDLMKDPEIGFRFVPIIPDEARTFGLDAIFPTAKIYSPHGQEYDAVDRQLVLSYKESTTGQILHEGISEAGSTASLIAASTAYATHGQPMIPFYIFYSMFGFQRTGDQFWQLADQLGRGFVFGATAGRTTLTGEGLQHADGHSPLLASTNPAAVVYDPAFAFEITHIVKDGLRRMYGPGTYASEAENVFYYLTIYNEPITQPAEPENLDVDGLLRGLYLYSGALGIDGRPRARVLASGIAMPWALEAQRLLGEEWNVDVDVWSVTSWNELRRDAVECERANLLDPSDSPAVPYVTRKLAESSGQSSRCRTSCARCPIRSRGGCRPTTPPSAPTVSASPTPEARPGASSTSTRSRSWSRCSSSWPRRGRSRPKPRARRSSDTTCSTSTRPMPATPPATHRSYAPDDRPRPERAAPARSGAASPGA